MKEGELRLGWHMQFVLWECVDVDLLVMYHELGREAQVDGQFYQRHNWWAALPKCCSCQPLNAIESHVNFLPTYLGTKFQLHISRPCIEHSDLSWDPCTYFLLFSASQVSEVYVGEMIPVGK